MLEDYIFLNINKYFDNVDFPINIFILAISIGACIASFCATVHKRYTAALLRGLIRHGAVDESTAVTISRMHIKLTLPLRSALLRRGQLTDMVAMVETDEKITKDNLHNARLYVKADKLTRAQRISEGIVPSYVTAAVSCFLFISIALALVILMPEILSLLSGLR